MQNLLLRFSLTLLCLLYPISAVSEDVFADGVSLFAAPADLGEEELSMQVIAAELSRAEARVGVLFDKYQRIRMVQTWGGHSARARLFDALSANHVHGPSCIHFYQSDYAAVVVPDIAQEAEEARQALGLLRERVATLQGRVTALERGLTRAERDLATQ